MDTSKNKALELHERGYSYSEIAEELAISKSTAHAWVKDAMLNEQEQREQDSSVHEYTFDSFETANTDKFERFSNERSTQSIKGNVRVKEPSYVTELQEKLRFLESVVQSLKSHVSKIDLLLIDNLKKSCTNVYKTMRENQGEIWSLDELYAFVNQLEANKNSMLSIDDSSEDWIVNRLEPLLQILYEAIQGLIDEDLDEGELQFFND